MTAEGDMTDQGAADAGISVTQRESPMEHLEGWFRGHEAQIAGAEAGVTPLADDMEPVLRSHFSGVFALLARVMADPELKALEPDVLALAQTALRVVGIGAL
jgi:hypothetical protein